MQKVQTLDFASCWKLDDKALKAICNTCFGELRQLRLACCKVSSFIFFLSYSTNNEIVIYSRTIFYLIIIYYFI